MIYILPTDTCYGIACPLDNKQSYEKIYKIKKRSFDKPLAIMVPSFDWLEKNTDLSSKQIDDLKSYKHPFTVLTQSTPIELFLTYQDDNEELLINKDVYEQIAFRVANTDLEIELLQETGPIWLTSANLSNQGEIYDFKTIDTTFEYYIESGQIELVWSYDLDPSVWASDIFSYEWDTLDKNFLRKHSN